MHMHQPWRVKQYSIFDVASDHGYFERPNNPDQDNQLIFNKVARKSYLPMNELLLELLQGHPEFKLSLSISGTVLEQAKQFNPRYPYLEVLGQCFSCLSKHETQHI